MVISFLCSTLESSLLSTPISYILMREEEGYKPATLFKQYKTDPERPLAAILSLNTIANTIGAAGVGQQANILFGSRWFGLVSAISPHSDRRLLAQQRLCRQGYRPAGGRKHRL